MKKNLVPMVTALAIFGFMACNNGTDETTGESTSTTTTNESSGESSAGTSTPAFDENASYVDLNTGKTVKLKKDPQTGKVSNQEDNTEVLFYFNPVTNDTFNSQGYVVNNYLIRSNDGSYRLDDVRWKTKLDEDGDFKAKDGDETKFKTDGKEPEAKLKDENSKEKIDENSYKLKTKDGKVKIKDDGTIKTDDR